MKVQVAIRHESADGKIKAFVEEELERLNKKYRPDSAEVVIDHEGPSGYIKTVEIKVYIPGETFHTKENSDDIHKSLDMAIKAIEKQLQRHKELHIPGPAKKQKHPIGEEEV
jgi:ribosomal subunit interface protein